MGKPVPKPQKSKTKSLKQKCIELSGKIVLKINRCLKCGSPILIVTLDPHHIIKRSHARTVARTDNQIPLCRYKCHRWAEDHPDAFNAWIDDVYPGRRLMLEAVARVPGKVQWDEVYNKLQDEAKIAGVL